MNPAMKFRAKKHGHEIELYGDIGTDITAKEFAAELKALGDAKNIVLRINSFGGDVFDGLAIYSRLVASGADITVFIDGLAGSIASVIAMAGKEIHIAEAAFIMIHDPWVRTAGNAAELIKSAARLETVGEQMAGIYQRRTGLKMGRIQEMMAAETELNASQAVEFGFATEIFEAERLAAKYDPARHCFKSRPAATLPPRMAAAKQAITKMQMQIVR